MRLHAKFQRGPRESGQALVIFAIAAVATFSFVGLVLDGSNLYHQRRKMQNAADAGALAGARVLVSGGVTNEEVLDAVKSYAERNGSDLSQLEAYYGNAAGELDAITDYSSAAAPPATASSVRVVSRTTVKVMFGYFLGQAEKTAGAEAYASFGLAGSAMAGSGIFPVTLEDDTLALINVGDTIEIWDNNQIVDNLGNTISGHRGWLNLDFVYADGDVSRATSQNLSNAKLKKWVEFGKNPPIPLRAGSVGGVDGDFINGDPGTRASSVQKAATRIGDRVLIPIYDTVYSKSDMRSAFPSHGSSFWANTSYYHIVGFAEFEITSVKSAGNLKGIEGKFLSPSLIDGTIATTSPGVPGFDESTMALALTGGYGG